MMNLPADDLPWPRPAERPPRFIQWTIEAVYREADFKTAPRISSNSGDGIDAIILSAQLNGSVETLVALGKNETVRRRIMEKFAAPARRGRPPGSALESCLWLVDQVWAVWKRRYGRWQRRDKLAYEVAARIARDLGVAVNVEQLSEFRRKHGKKAHR